MDLLDLYRGALSYRQLCALVTHLTTDAAVWCAHQHDGGHTNAELLLAAIERRITVLWATVAAAFGQQIAEEHLAGPLDRGDSGPESPPEPELRSLREIAAWMRG